LKYPSFR